MKSASQIQLSSTSSKRITELDGLRAFAILPVIMLHAAPRTGPLSVLWPFLQVGWIGVDLFFVLSGFLITGILLDTASKPHFYRNFIVRRALRILPLYYLCLILYSMATFSVGRWEELLKWGSPGWFAVYAGNIKIAIESAYPPVGNFVPLWSLQVEEQFYILYPLLIALCPIARLPRVLTAIVIMAIVLRGAAMLLFPSNGLICYVLTPCRMDALGMGAIVAVMMRNNILRLSIRSLQLCLAVGILTCILMFSFISTSASHPFHTLIGYSILDATFAILLILVISMSGSAIVAPLRWRLLVYTGQIAYGLYLLHGPAGSLFRKLMSGIVPIEEHSTANLPLTLVASFLVAGISWRYFECPILAWKERFTLKSS